MLEEGQKFPISLFKGQETLKSPFCVLLSLYRYLYHIMAIQRLGYFDLLLSGFSLKLPDQSVEFFRLPG